MRLCAAPERKNKQRISHERGILFFCFQYNVWGYRNKKVLKKSNPESEDETWEKEKVFSNGF